MRHLVWSMPVAAPGPVSGWQYVPGCDCGWSGAAFIRQDEATTAAVAHAKQVTKKGDSDGVTAARNLGADSEPS